jgi:two-component system, LytTR family, response regulator
MKVTALLAEDEPLARRKLRELIADVAWLEYAGEAADGEAALRMIDDLRPELLFLDIELPGLDGLAVLDRIRHRPAVIFTTAYDRHAVAAFELGALDYLLKPFGRGRFEAAVERARHTLDVATLERVPRAFGASEPLTRLFVRDRGRILPLALQDVTRLSAQDDYVEVHAGPRRHLVHLPLSELERRLDPSRFVRVHRSHIVNVDHVAAFDLGEDGRLEVVMKDATCLVASRSRSRQLRPLLNNATRRGRQGR